MNNVGTIKLETDRLILRRLELNDAEKMFNNWCNNKGIKNSFVNYIWWKDNIMIKKEK